MGSWRQRHPICHKRELPVCRWHLCETKHPSTCMGPMWKKITPSEYLNIYRINWFKSDCIQFISLSISISFTTNIFLIFSWSPRRVLKLNHYIFKPLKWRPFIDYIESKCVIKTESIGNFKLGNYSPHSTISPISFLDTSAPLSNREIESVRL